MFGRERLADRSGSSTQGEERTYIKDDKVEEEHEDVDDEGGNALQLAHNGLGVLQGERQMLPLLHVTACLSSAPDLRRP